MIKQPFSQKIFIYTHNGGHNSSLKIKKKIKACSLSMHFHFHTTVALLLAEIVVDAKEITTTWD